MQSSQACETARLEYETFKKHLEESGALGVERPVRISASSARALEGTGTRSDGELCVHFVRHGQGFHNLLSDLYHEMGRQFDPMTGEGENPYGRPEVLDPPLTEVGRSQARMLQPDARALKPEVIVVSPMVRATQTALLAFSHLVEGAATKVPFIAHEGCHEIGGINVCDHRRPLKELQSDFPMIDYTTAAIQEEDPTWSDAVREPLSQLAERGYDFLLWLRSRPERNIAVVSHSGFLNTLLNAVVECDDGKLAEKFLTGEMRSLRLRFEDRRCSKVARLEHGVPT